ncbi:MAG TPA: hypothetical protein VEG38_05135 [Acidimicrobiia bacterium]|nr:hypothetical protein [Acidimicrobiia bacterium]
MDDVEGRTDDQSSDRMEGASPIPEWRAPEGTDRPAPRRARRVPVAVGTVVALLAGAMAFVVVRQDGGEAAGAKPVKSAEPPKHPSAWDPRLTDLVDFVEKDRDLRFEHPVYVDFLTPEEYKTSAAAEAQKLTDKERREIEQTVSLLRSFGLLEGDVDLLDRMIQLTEEGTLAYYDPMTERVTVRGTELTLGVKGTLVHELTHALQDQHFDLKPMVAEDQTMKEAEAASHLRNLVEGDAVRVENHWVESLGKTDQKTYAEQGQAVGNEADLEGIPEVIIAAMGTPYSFGHGLVEAIAATGGNTSVDMAFRSPPTSDEQIFDAFRYLAKDQPQTVAAPALKEGEQTIPDSEPQSFGAFMLFVTLAQRLDPVPAMRAVDGWGGDQMVIFNRDGRQCARVHLAADSVADRNEMQAALQKWVAGMPAGVASLSRAGELIELNSCDPGAKYKPAGRSIQEALNVPLTRVTMAVTVMAMWDADAEQARCYTGKVIQEFTVEELSAPTATPADTKRIEELAASCIS